MAGSTGFSAEARRLLSLEDAACLHAVELLRSHDEVVTAVRQLIRMSQAGARKAQERMEAPASGQIRKDGVLPGLPLLLACLCAAMVVRSASRLCRRITEQSGELSRVCRQPLESRGYLGPEVAGAVLRACRKQAANPIDLPSDREHELLQSIAEGRTNKEIANLLDLSVCTIDGHRTRIMEKLNRHSVSGLVRFAVRHGPVD